MRTHANRKRSKNRRSLLRALLLALGTAFAPNATAAHSAANPAIAQETSMIPSDIIETAKGPLTIQPIDHASIVLSWNRTTIHVDPTGPAERFAGLPKPDLILYTHQHGDHFSLDLLEALAGAQTTIVAPKAVTETLPETFAKRVTTTAPGEIIVFGALRIETLPAHNLTPDRLRYHPEGMGVGYVLGFEDRRVYVSGDTEGIPQMLALENIDIAFLPMNLPYTMTGPEAAAAARAFAPRVVYPFHYLGGAENEAFAEALADEPGIEVRLRDWYAMR